MRILKLQLNIEITKSNKFTVNHRNLNHLNRIPGHGLSFSVVAANFFVFSLDLVVSEDRPILIYEEMTVIKTNKKRKIENF